MGADETETVLATPMDPSDRFRLMEGQQTIQAWTKFTFPGRGDNHSSFTWSWRHFDGVDYNALRPDYKAVWVFEGKSFDDKVSLETGNFDFLMGCDVDIDDPDVQAELKRWGEWTLDHVGVDGFRLDAIKHIQGDFFANWIDHLETYAQRDLFCVGEYWSYDLNTLAWYAGNSAGKLNLFDAPLHHNFHLASRAGGHYDMSRILDGTLMKKMPLLAVTLVENHDTQPLQAWNQSWSRGSSPLPTPSSCFAPKAIRAFSTLTTTEPATLIVAVMARWWRSRWPLIVGSSIGCCSPACTSLMDSSTAISITSVRSAGRGSAQGGDHPFAMAVLLSDGPA